MSDDSEDLGALDALEVWPSEPDPAAGGTPPASRRGAISLARGAQLPPEMLAQVHALAEALELPLEEALAACLAHGAATMTDEEVRAVHRALQAQNDTGFLATPELRATRETKR